jgi:DNA-binding response OmpR family regulator
MTVVSKLSGASMVPKEEIDSVRVLDRMNKEKRPGMPEKNARILIIDDDVLIRSTTAMFLEAAGYVVDTAENGKEGIEKSYSNFYNLALIDMRLPDMEGLELLTKLRETTPKMAKIIVTGYAALNNAIGSVNNGADGYVTKPTDPEKLLTMIRAHLRKQEEMKQYSEDKVAEFITSRIASIETKEKDQETTRFPSQ